MNTQILLQCTLAALTILGTALLGSGQQNMTLTILMMVAAPTAVACTDRYQWFRLSRTMANLAAIGSVAYAVFQFASSGGDNQLLSVANLLVYLQLILLFQEKSHRLNWQLLVLSLLEVVVAAAMNLNFRFFILLLAYLFLALVAMALLYVLREASRFDASADERKKSRGAEGGRGGERLSPVLRSLLGSPPQVSTSTTRESLPRELGRASYMGQVGTFGVVTLAFATVLFYSTPRLGGAGWQGSRGRGHGQATVGFSRQISLDEMGEILQSDELALRISFFDHATNEPLTPHNEPYLRGGVMTSYGDSQGVGRWTISSAPPRGVLLDEARSMTGLVRQEIWIEPTGEATVFGAFPLVRLPGVATPLRLDRAAGAVSREQPLSGLPAGRYHFEVGTYSFREGWQTAVSAPDLAPPPTAESAISTKELADCLRFKPFQFPGIQKLARQVLEEADATESDTLRKARILEQHFQQPGRYQYSLRFRNARNREMDPVEDFVLNHRTGHCEYFATALTLMLRSQQIPARLVVGYHGGEYNALGNYYLVRQRDAHAWVEVWLEPEEVALVGKGGLPYGDVSRGGWLRLDPTPGGGEANTQGMVWNRFDDVMEYAEFLWSDYVTGLNRERQRQTFYAPLWERVTTSVSAFFDPVEWRAWSAATLSQWLRRWGVVNELGDFGWRLIVGIGVAFTMAVLVAKPIAALAGRAARWCAGRLARLAGASLGRRNGARRGRVEFYERFERLLARRGVVRAPHQTPREFLDEASRVESIALHRPLWGEAAGRIVEAFYHVRFGGTELAPDEAAAIAAALRQVEAGLAGRTVDAPALA